MFGFLKFLFLCALAIVAGVAAVAIPIEGKTAAEHVRALVEEQLAGGPAPKKPAQGAPPRMARQRPSQPERAPADDHTEEDRRALDQLIGQKVR
ncbi:hypothetical protein [Vulgatibacter sp.]|uniref:hypothetical protein n=1 Tax=Vulgatibacter sp. TaxID=1971226 RepID=UPI003561AF95